MTNPIPICPPPPPRCTELPSLKLPMGITLLAQPSHPAKQLDPCECLFALATQAGPAMGGLAPVLTVIDGLVSVFKVVEAIPAAIIELDPFAVIEAIKEAGKKMAKLAGLIPQLSLPITILSLIDFIILALDCIITKLDTLAALLAALDEKMAIAIEKGNAQLIAIIDCAQQDAQRQAQALGVAFGALAPFINILNLLLGMIPGGIKLDLETAGAGGTIDDILVPLVKMRDALKAARELIPL